MNTVLCAAMRAGVVMLFVIAGAGAAARHNTRVNGRVIAFRPYDRMIQFSSFVTNEEVFLFEMLTARGQRRTIKVRYRHVGVSEITEQILEQALPLKLELERDRACDETYSQFVSSAPGLRDQSGETWASGIRFVEAFKDVKPPEELKLDCYLLPRGHVHLSEVH